MPPPAIKVENLSKEYLIGARQGHQTFREAIVSSFAYPFDRLNPRSRRKNGQPEKIWALKDVSFEIGKGEKIGIIGRNGAGKSTLLKILSRITEPTGGRAVLKGRVGSLLEIGTGFHAELSGRENVFLYGAILGMTRSEVAAKFDEIIAFSELEKFVDTPVKRYSSGMYMRLAFAVAAHLEPEILLVDEVLAVGDLAFQKKCLGKMGDMAGAQRTVMFVSHNMAAVESLCTRTYLIERGTVTAQGKTADVVNAYLNSIKSLVSTSLAERKDRSGNGGMRFVKMMLEDEAGAPTDFAVSGKDAHIVIDYEAANTLHNVSLSLGVYGAHGQFLLMCNNEMVGRHFETIPKKGRFRCVIPGLPFTAGTYNLNLYAEVNGLLADWVQEAYQMTVVEGDFYGTGKSSPRSHGGFLVRHSWEVTAVD